jgi:phosphatidylserine/phosphatidylglycerophosphate/cardiolipin synthase-like enzyme
MTMVQPSPRVSHPVDPSHWFLSAAERGNPATRLDRGHPGGQAWSEGNLVRPLIHGATYFAELATAVEAQRAGDLLLFVDWRGDPDERLTADPDSEVGQVFCRAAERGVLVRGLIWRSHWDRLAFSAEQNRHLGEEINAAGGCCLLDMRVRTGGSHHQKFVVLRHPGRPERDVAFVGGIDLCHSRRDDADHGGDPQSQPMARVYTKAPPWHDIQLAITGPAVADVETVFRERWEDPQRLSRSPLRRLADLVRHDDGNRDPLPEQLPPPEPTGPHTLQLLRTYARRLGGYPFAPNGERSVARGFIKALGRAEQLIYIEDQYLWSTEVGGRIAGALRDHPRLQVVAVIPRFPDQDGRMSLPPDLIGRRNALRQIREAAPGRVWVYGIENHQGTPVYVHAKVCIMDDSWATVGSDNINRRSWTHDSELSVAVCGGEAGSRFARDLRLTLAAEHLDGVVGSDDPSAMVTAFARSAQRLQAWYDGGRHGSRPPGRLRPNDDQPLPLRTRLWAEPLYRTVYDPDARSLPGRRRDVY